MSLTRSKSLIAVPAIGLMALALAACGKAGSSGTDAPDDVAGAGCAPVAGTSLVVLEDDKKLQNADNIIAAVNADAASESLLAAVNKVAASLDTQKLVGLNKAVDVDRKTPAQAAEEFATTAGLATGLSGGSGDITVGHGNFSESNTIAELYKIALEASGFTVKLQDVGNRELYEPALEKGDIQVMPEYAATLAEFLNGKTNGKDAAPVASSDLAATVTALQGLAEKNGLVVGEASPAADVNVYAVTKEFADQHQVKTLSDFAAKCSGKASILGGPPECPERAFCQPGLKDTYGIEFGQFSSLDVGPLTQAALKAGEITVGTTLSTDGGLAAG
ncbi:glycine betaine ABC transporter substrate-binding protein [Phytomonospora endophytica]|uniref:Osmoprotectant transport system substrate-binding protein n=1 Tax=Phytomonospora endophytica TaxID=714109 RepID=A0A841FZT2_9ACTN|nr:glycine betaine ABC transporter substrate-binding protein [Phytomonospora endophytica]MBB6039032.1 osmoprotectant transport system substrate-binding protein [Phytomonospora endophytica]GIG69510.1 hypothetical protein Pen01_58050 [Phytomonospora endophytica]